jgi:hypothetical protein
MTLRLGDCLELACTFSFLFMLMATCLSWMFFPALATHGRSIKTFNTGNMAQLGLPFRALATLHGQTISKRYFLCFYTIPVCMLMLLNLVSQASFSKALGSSIGAAKQQPFIFHSLRRWIETYFYTRKTRSRMTLLQFIQGVLYYCTLSVHILRSQCKVRGSTFLVANVMQGIAHYRVYRLGKQEFYHYYCEVLLYLIVLCDLRSLSMLFNFLYVVLFVKITIGNRLNCRGC